MDTAKQTINVVFITDDNYALPTGIALESLFCHRATHIHYHIYMICDGVSPSHKEKFLSKNTSQFSVILTDMSEKEKFQGIEQGVAYVTLTALYKFMLAEIFQDLDKIIYLDGDTLILTDLVDLYETDLTGFYVGAVPDMVMNQRIATKREKNLPFAKTYFNSGVMLLNLDLMRRDNTSEALIEYKKNGVNFFMDQDALNVVLGEKKKDLHPKYNDIRMVHKYFSKPEIADFFQIPLEEIGEHQFNGENIIHCSSREKPWKNDIYYISDLFLQYKKTSPFAEDVLTIEKKEYAMGGIEEQLNCSRARWQVFEQIWGNVQNETLIFCGGGVGSMSALSFFQEKGLPLPKAICDNNTALQGNTIKEIPVLSFQDAFSLYPDAFYFITARNFDKEIYIQLSERINPCKILAIDPSIKTGVYHDFSVDTLKRLRDHQE